LAIVGQWFRISFFESISMVVRRIVARAAEIGFAKRLFPGKVTLPPEAPASGGCVFNRLMKVK
jgi:hypothetical protein